MEGKVVNLNDFDETNLQKCLQGILDAFSRFPEAKDDFMNTFPIWVKEREENIRLLKELANDLDKHKANCNISKIVGTSVGIAGGVTALIGVPLVVLTGGLAVPILLAVGVGLSAAGGSTVAGTVITDIVIDKKQVAKVKVLLKKDKADSEKLFELIKQRREVELAVEEIMSMDAFEKIMTHIDTAKNIFKSVTENIPTYNLLRELNCAVSNLAASSDEKQKAIDLFKNIFNSSVCLDLFEEIIRVCKPMISIFKNISQLIKCIVSGWRILTDAIDTGSTVATLTHVAMASRIVPRVVATAIVILSTVNVVINIVELVMAAKNLAGGSKSESASRFRKCAEHMEAELFILTDIYVELESQW